MNSDTNKYNNSKKDENSSNRKKTSVNKLFDKYSHKKQGKMNPREPFSKITVYESETESELEVSQDSEVETPVAFASSNSSLGSTAENVLLVSLKNKAILSGVDFIWVMAKLQGKGAASLKGSELKRHLSWKECKMSISKMALAGGTLKQLEEFLTSTGIHLTSNSTYVEISSDIVSAICKILTNCGMENVDHGVMFDYFNRRFADLRNRRNYEAK
jgi:hypothetical protein